MVVVYNAIKIINKTIQSLNKQKIKNRLSVTQKYYMKSNQYISRLIVFAIYLIPIIGLIDFFISVGILSGAPSRGRADHPFPEMIVGKEVLILIVFALLTLIMLHKVKMQKISAIILMAVGLLTLHSTSMIIMVAGFRESLCFAYVIAGKFLSDRSQMNQQYDGKASLVKGLKIVLLIEFVLALLQTQLMSPAEGLNFFGSRPLGTFTNPSTLGVFGALSILLLILFKEKNEKIGVLYFTCSTILALLSGSRVAVMLLLLILGMNQLTKIKPYSAKVMVFFLGIFVLAITAVNINFITNKPSSLSLLEGPRMLNFINYLTSSDAFHLMFGHGWGIYTSWYFSLSPPSYYPPLDSFYASILAQIGLFGSLILAAFMYWLFSQAGKKGRYLLIVFAIIGLQINVFEYYPVNLLIFLALGVLISEEKSLISSSNVYPVFPGTKR